MVYVSCFDSKGNYLGNLNLWTDLSKKKIFFREVHRESGIIGSAEIKLQRPYEDIAKEVGLRGSAQTARDENAN